MKDCTTCKDRVELHPEYRHKQFEDTPCFLCFVGRHNADQEYIDGMKLIAAPTQASGEVLKVDADLWDSLTLRQKDIARAFAFNPNSKKQEIRRLLKIPHMTFYRELKRIAHVFKQYMQED